MIAALRKVWGVIERDVNRYFALESRTGQATTAEKLRILRTSSSLHAVLVHRLSHFVRCDLRGSRLQRPLGLLCSIAERIGGALWQVHINAAAEIGPGLYLCHQGGVWIGPVKIGADCSLTHNTTIGRRSDDDEGTPVLGNRVWVGTGSVLFGKISVGDGATIGPLSAVSRDIPARALAMGNPARIVALDYDNSCQMDGLGSRAPVVGSVPAPVEVRAVPAAPTTDHSPAPQPSSAAG